MGVLFTAIALIPLGKTKYIDGCWEEYNKLKEDPEFIKFVNERFDRIEWAMENKVRVALPRNVDDRLSKFREWQEERS